MAVAWPLAGCGSVCVSGWLACGCTGVSRAALGFVPCSCLLGPFLASVGVMPFGALVSGRPSIFGLWVYGNRIALRLERKKKQPETHQSFLVSETGPRRTAGGRAQHEGGDEEGPRPAHVPAAAHRGRPPAHPRRGAVPAKLPTLGSRDARSG